MFQLTNRIKQLQILNIQPSKLFSTTQQAQAIPKAIRKARSIERKKLNISIQHAKVARQEKIDPVLGRPNNPFLTRIEHEIAEPKILTKGFEINDVEKLLFGAKQAKLLKSKNSLGYDEFTEKKIEAEENEKKDIILRILDIRNSNNLDKQKLLTESAVNEFSRYEGDTGSSEVQAAVMTVELYNLMSIVKQNPQDLVHIRKARMLTQKRQRILRYLKRDDPERYFYVIEKLGLTDETVHAEFNFDKKYMEEFEVWPGRKLVKTSKAEGEARKKQRRAEKKALRRAMTERLAEKER